MDKELKIAVLIDAENVSSKYVNIILQEASSLGNLIYKRIYGNWTTSLLNSWKTQLLDNAIQPIQQYSNTTGKNSSDSALIIDAMDLLYQKNLDAFCIVSSDSDFTRLASRLRESEMYVMGMGEKKTPRAFISACNKFVYLDLIYKANKESASKTKKKSNSKKKQPASHALAKTEAGSTELAKSSRRADASKTETSKTDATKPKKDQRAGQHDGAAGSQAEQASRTEPKAAAQTLEEHNHRSEDLADELGNGTDIIAVENALREIAEEFSGDDGWIHSSSLGARLARRLPDFDTRNFGFKKFVPFIESLGYFESKTVKENGSSGVKTVYFRLIEE